MSPTVPYRQGSTVAQSPPQRHRQALIKYPISRALLQFGVLFATVATALWPGRRAGVEGPSSAGGHPSRAAFVGAAHRRHLTQTGLVVERRLAENLSVRQVTEVSHTTHTVTEINHMAQVTEASHIKHSVTEVRHMAQATEVSDIVQQVT